MSAVSAFPSFSQPRMSAKTSGVVACIDCTDRNAWIYPHALALASTLDVPVTLLQVLDRDASPDARPDPIECNLRRREAMRVLDRCAATIEPSSSQTTIELAEGPAAEEICRYVRECDEGMVVLGRRGRKEAGRDGVGGTVHKVLSQAPGPVLLVPVEAPVPGSAYRRIVVPLDGSRWAESVLPLAVRLAKAADAELLLVHVVPTPEMIQARPLETEDETLRENLIERNEQAARSYLAQSARSCDFGHLGEHVGNGLVVVDDRPCEERRSAPIRERRYEPWRFEWGSDRLLEPEFFGHRVRDRQSGDGTTGIGGSA